MYRRGRLGDPLVTIDDATLNMRDLLSLLREMLEGASEQEASEFRKNLSRIMGIRELEQPSCCYESLSSFLSRIGGSMQPDRVLEGFTILARVMNFHRLLVCQERREMEGWTNGHLQYLSERMVDFWVTSASLPWAIKHNLPPYALIQCWELVRERLRRESLKEGWWPLANEEWESTDGGYGSYHLGPYEKFKIPKACQFGLSDKSYPDWRIANALEDQLCWLMGKLGQAIGADEHLWNPLPVDYVSDYCVTSYRSVFRISKTFACYIGSPWRPGVSDRVRRRDLPSIDKDYELGALRDAISDVNARLTSLKEKVAAERKSDRELIEANVSFLGCMSHNFREIGV